MQSTSVCSKPNKWSNSQKTHLKNTSVWCWSNTLKMQSACSNISLPNVLWLTAILRFSKVAKAPDFLGVSSDVSAERAFCIPVRSPPVARTCSWRMEWLCESIMPQLLRKKTKEIVLNWIKKPAKMTMVATWTKWPLEKHDDSQARILSRFFSL